MMRRSLSGWAESGRAVGEALVAVWRAELDALRRDFADSGRELRRAAVLAAAAAAVCFWTIGLGLWAAVEGLATRWPRWAAVSAVFAAGVLVALLLGWVASRRARRLEPPLETVRRHGREHLDWWQDSVLPDLAPLAGRRARAITKDDDESESG
jgi:Putative Actinobacterial Holin-X, holin superfamily III